MIKSWETPTDKECVRAFLRWDLRGLDETSNKMLDEKEGILAPVVDELTAWLDAGIEHTNKFPWFSFLPHGVQAYTNAPATLYQALEDAQGEILQSILQWMGIPNKKWREIVQFSPAMRNQEGQEEETFGIDPTLPAIMLVHAAQKMPAREGAQLVADNWYARTITRVYAFIKEKHDEVSREGEGEWEEEREGEWGRKDTRDPAMIIEKRHNEEMKMQRLALSPVRGAAYWAFKSGCPPEGVSRFLRSLGERKGTNPGALKKWYWYQRKRAKEESL